MRKARQLVTSAILLAAVSAPMQNCLAQSPQDISRLLRNSKLVDTGREVNATLSAGQVSISTFAHPKAKDQDCKITALLMMKELRQHYRNIRRSRVLFFDPANPSQYREVAISESEVQLVDAGRPVPEVLSRISVRNGSYERQGRVARAAGRGSGAGRSLAGRRGGVVNVDSADDETFCSRDGEISVWRPRDWITTPEVGSYLMKTGTVKVSGGFVEVTLYRLIFPAPPSLSEWMDRHEAETRGRAESYTRVTRRNQDCNGFPGLFLECRVKNHSGAETIERCQIFLKDTHCFSLIMLSHGMNEGEMGSLYQKMLSSIKVRG